MGMKISIKKADGGTQVVNRKASQVPDFFKNTVEIREAREVPDPPKTPQDAVRTNAERMAANISTQRDVFKSKGVAMNAQALIEADFLIRRSILDILLDPRHEIDKECGYPADITPLMYHMLYERDGLAKRIVDILPDESWAADPDVFENEGGETSFEIAWEALVKRLNIWHMLHRADRLSGVARFGILLLGLGDGEDYSSPADGINERGEKVGDAENSLLFLRAFDETLVRVNLRESDVSNPRFGRPTLYTLIFKDLDITELAGSGIATIGDVTKRVHWTRLIHLADNREMSEVYGVPRMKPMFNRIMDVRKVLSGSGEMFWKGAFPGISFELNPGVGDVELDMDTIKEEMERYQNGLQRYLALTGMTAKSLAPTVADPKEHLIAQLDQICIALGCPKRIFTGSEEGKLASSQDAKSWAKRCAHRQQKYITPMVIRPFIDRLVALGVLPEPKQYDVFWPDLLVVTDQEKANAALIKTQALQAYVTGGVDQIMSIEDFLEEVMGMSTDKIQEMERGAKIDAGEKFESSELDHIEGATAPATTSFSATSEVEAASGEQIEVP